MPSPAPPGGPTRLSAVVTTYKPDAAFVARFMALLETCDRVFVVDNTPGGSRFELLPARFSVIQDGINHGLAHALNRGVLGAKDAGADYVVLFDQDSTPSAETTATLLAACRRAQTQFGEQCGVGPTHVDDASGTRMEPRLQFRPTSEPCERTCLPTSGLLFPLRTIGADTLFSPELFLDLVDFEWCWRQRRAGWRFLRVSQAPLLHRYGIEERRWLGLRFHVPAPYRHYFQFRDTLRLAARRYVPLYSKVRLVGVLPMKLLLYPFILDHGTERLRWMMRGVLDAIRGINGIGAASETLSR